MRAPRIDGDNVQGNVLAGFNKDHQAFLFLHLPETLAAAQAWLASTVSEVATHADVSDFNALYRAYRTRHQGAVAGVLGSRWTNLALTPSGLARLGHSEDIGSSPEAFREGLAHRAAKLGHTGSSAPAHWLEPFRPAGGIDVVVIVAGDDPRAVDREADRHSTRIAESGGEALLRLDGHARPDLPGHEHFGFKDGVSQPGVRGVTKPENPNDPNQGVPGQDLIWPGEFVLGYASQSRPPAAEHARGPVTPARPAWTRHGSFLVFERLLQDVAGFEHEVRKVAAQHGIAAELLAAKLVGRHKSGCPLEILSGPLGDAGQTRTDVGVTDPRLVARKLINDFEFEDLDADGHIVPRASHIRKAYPRDERPPGERATQTHRILRRGIAFGDPYRADAPPGSPHHAAAARGLLFACYQSSIEQQFEFVQTATACSDFPRPRDGADLILNQAASARMEMPGVVPSTVHAPPFVRMTGGAYFFAPSLDALRKLSGL